MHFGEVKQGRPLTKGERVYVACIPRLKRQKCVKFSNGDNERAKDSEPSHWQELFHLQILAQSSYGAEEPSPATPRPGCQHWQTLTASPGAERGA